MQGSHNPDFITIWRDSVHAGDDADAPHELTLEAAVSEPLDSLLRRVLSRSYLAQISGGRATWIVCAGAAPLAVVAQQWLEPRYLADSGGGIPRHAAPGRTCDLEFRYWCQADPDLVFDSLRRGEELPSRYES